MNAHSPFINRYVLLRHLRQQFQINWWSHHGIAHWARVRANGLMLVDQTGANRHVVELFSFFHDSRRFNEHVDDGYGACGARAPRLRSDFTSTPSASSCKEASERLIDAAPTVTSTECSRGCGRSLSSCASVAP